MYTFLRTMHLLRRLPKTSLAEIAIRNISTSSAMYKSRSLLKMKQIQAKFQCEDGNPVFLKAGFRDRVLYLLTLALSLFGLAMSLLTLFEHAKPLSWKTDPMC